MKLKGRVALITGGNSGLGQAMVYDFLREGAKVAFCGRNQKRNEETVKEAKSLGFEDVIGIAADVGSSASVKDMFKQVLDRFGTLDILVNNAALLQNEPRHIKQREDHLNLVTTPVAAHSLEITKNMSDEEWEKSIQVNLNGVFYCCREALNIMEPKGYGRIVNIASIAGIAGLSAHSPNYSAAKGGVVAFTRSLGVEVAGAGVIVNCIAPGGIATKDFNQILEHWGPKLTGQIMQLSPLRRFGTLREYTSLAIYLSSEDAGFLVGQIISPNGGTVWT